MKKLKKIFFQKIWKNNCTLNQLLGLCPLLAVTSTAVSSISLGLTITFTLILTNFFISLLRRWIPSEIRIPIYIMIIASIVSLIKMMMNAFTFILYQSLGNFIPLIVTNCIIVSRAEAFAIKNNPITSILDGFYTGMNVTCIMFSLGSLREILGNGTLLKDSEILFGSWSKILYIQVFNTKTPFLLSILPPGAFISLGLILSIKNIFDEKRSIFSKLEKSKKNLGK